MGKMRIAGEHGAKKGHIHPDGARANRAVLVLLTKLRQTSGGIDNIDFFVHNALDGVSGGDRNGLPGLARKVCTTSADGVSMVDRDSVLAEMRKSGFDPKDEERVRSDITEAAASLLDALMTLIPILTSTSKSLSEISLHKVSDSDHMRAMRICHWWGIPSKRALDGNESKAAEGLLEMVREEKKRRGHGGHQDAHETALPEPAAAVRDIKSTVVQRPAPQGSTERWRQLLPTPQPRIVAPTAPRGPIAPVVPSRPVAPLSTPPRPLTPPPAPPAPSVQAAGAKENKEGFESRTAPIDTLVPLEGQPRRRVSRGELDELADSVRKMGVLTAIPVIEDPSKQGRYLMYGGHRRLEAARIVGLKTVPISVNLKAGLSDLYLLAAVDNVARRALRPVEEAITYRELEKRYGMTQGQIAENMGSSVGHITSALALLRLPSEIHDMIDADRRVDRLPRLFGWELLSISKAENQIRVARRFLELRAAGKLDLSGGVPTLRRNVITIARDLGITEFRERTTSAGKPRESRLIQMGRHEETSVMQVRERLERIAGTSDADLRVMFPDQKMLARVIKGLETVIKEAEKAAKKLKTLRK